MVDKEWIDVMATLELVLLFSPQVHANPCSPGTGCNQSQLRVTRKKSLDITAISGGTHKLNIVTRPQGKSAGSLNSLEAFIQHSQPSATCILNIALPTRDWCNKF